MKTFHWQMARALSKLIDVTEHPTRYTQQEKDTAVTEAKNALMTYNSVDHRIPPTSPSPLRIGGMYGGWMYQFIPDMMQDNLDGMLVIVRMGLATRTSPVGPYSALMLRMKPDPFARERTTDAVLMARAIIEHTQDILKQEGLGDWMVDSVAFNGTRVSHSDFPCTSVTYAAAYADQLPPHFKV